MLVKVINIQISGLFRDYVHFLNSNLIYKTSTEHLFN